MVDQPALFDTVNPPPAPPPVKRPARPEPAGDTCPCCQHRTPGGDWWTELTTPPPGGFT